MIDPILMARLDVLDQNLARVEDSKSWMRSLRLQRFEASDSLWAGYDKTIGQNARTQRMKLQDIRDQLAEMDKKGVAEPDDLKMAWHSYSEIYEQSRAIFDECLTFIGGLTFRDQGLDERICEVADELIRDLALGSRGDVWQSLTVPTMNETANKTIARIIRLRFQEWTIWSLPFTAHEFGHVVMGDAPEVQPWMNTEVERLVKGDAELQQVLAAGADPQARERATERARRRAEHHLNEYLADAFATYTMGPAYACAVILLRFNPAAAYEDDLQHPADARRAHVVLGMLQLMDQQAGKPPPYRYVCEYLEKEWQETIDRAQPPSALVQAEKDSLRELVGRIGKRFYPLLLPAARYPHTGDDGWTVAQAWSQGWCEASARQPLTVGSGKLRDVLNAAWLCRINNPQKVGEIAEAAQKLCDAIIEERRAAEKGTARKTKGRQTASAPR